MFDGHFAEYRGFLRQVADTQAGAFVYGQVAQFPPVQHHAACVGSDEPDYHVEAGGFACAVGPEQSDDFAAFDLKGETFDDLAFFETFLQVLDDEAAVVCAHKSLLGISVGKCRLNCVSVSDGIGVIRFFVCLKAG